MTRKYVLIELTQCVGRTLRRHAGILLRCSVEVAAPGLAGALLLAGCTGETGRAPLASASDHAPSIQSAKLSPDPPTLAGPISVIIDATDPDRDPLTFKYQWIVNDRPLTGEIGHTLAPDRFRRGDRVRAVVTAFDGSMDSSPVGTAQITVGNTPPIVSAVAIEPDSVHVGQRVEAKVETADADRDDVIVAYRWRKNGEVFKESDEPVLIAADLKPGDLLQAEAVPRDAQGPGRGLVSSPVLVRPTLPIITSQPPTHLADGRYEYAIQASAAAGETLRYRLEAGPAGMAIDPASGRVVWQATKEQLGLHRVKVVVQDGSGGTAFQEFEIHL